VLIIRINARFELQINSKLIAGFVEPTYSPVSRRYFRISVAITATTTYSFFQSHVSERLETCQTTSSKEQFLRQVSCNVFYHEETWRLSLSNLLRRKRFLLLRRFFHSIIETLPELSLFLFSCLLGQFCALRGVPSEACARVSRSHVAHSCTRVRRVRARRQRRTRDPDREDFSGTDIPSRHGFSPQPYLVASHARDLLVCTRDDRLLLVGDAAFAV